MSKTIPKYSLYSFIEIRFADPISAICMSDTHIIIGTMMGRIILYSIEDQKSSILSELSTENISSISYDQDSHKFTVCIGDDEIFRYYISNDNNNNLNPNLERRKNYQSESEHNRNCENAYILLSNKSLFRVQLSQPEEGNVTIINIDAEIEYKDLNNYNSEINTLPMTNYSVPLDFDGEKFCWVEFLSSIERNICVANVYNIKDNNIEKMYKKNVDKNFGHISHMKLLWNNMIFLCRKLNICEIRKIDEEFSLINSYKHIGDEVYAVDVYYDNNNNKNDTYENENDVEENNKNYININDNNVNNNNNMINDDENNNNDKQNEFYMKININKKKNEENLGLNDNNNNNNNEKDNKENENINQNNNNKNKNNNEMYIYTLDIDGNVNLYQNEKEYKLFNLYNIKGIPQDHKDKQFFSMGYAYYIKCNKNFICISTDHGAYVLKREKE